MVLWLVALLVGGAVIAGLAYNAGLAATATTSGAAAAAPPVWAYGWHWGWGFGFIFPLVFFVLIFALLFRAIFWGGRGYGPRRWDGPYGPDGYVSRREAAFDEWHRRAHADAGAGTQDPPSGAPDQSQNPPFGGR
jgi:hypothetical protein